MATAATMINDALKELGVLAEGDTATSTMSDDALRALNRIMGMMSNDKAFAYSNAAISRTLTAVQSFTIGAAGDLVATMPIRIDSAYCTLNGITYPVQVVDFATWDAIEYKASTGTVPDLIYYDPTMSAGTVYCWPISSGAVLYMRESSLVDSFATLATTLVMPAGYEEYLIKELAVNLAPQYPAGVLSPLTISARDRALKKIKRTNKHIPSLTPNVLTGGETGLAAIYRG